MDSSNYVFDVMNVSQQKIMNEEILDCQTKIISEGKMTKQRLSYFGNVM